MDREIKILFLGTGPSGRIPRPGCVRASCRDARRPGSRSRRLQSSLIISAGDATLLFDVSQDILKQWRHAKGVRGLDAVFISHPHNDAFGGLPKLATVMRTLGQERLTVYAEAATWARAHEQFGPLAFLDHRALHLDEPVTAGPFSVRPFRVEHTPNAMTHPTAGFDIRVAGRHIVLITDVKTVPPASLAGLARPDLLIMDCALFDLKFSNHVNFSEALALVARIKPRKTILTQIGTTWPPYDEAVRIARTAGVDISYDGLSYRL